MSTMKLYIVVYFIWLVVTSTRVDGVPANRDHQRDVQDQHSDPLAFERLDKNADQMESYPDEAIDKLSKVFGISRIPNHFRHGTPPEYMIKLYNMVAYEDGITKQAAPYNANKVRGVPDGARQQQILYKFDVSHVHNSEDILQVEFHLFKLSPRLLEGFGINRQEHTINLKLYQILDPGDLLNTEVQRMLLQKRLAVHNRGWERFEVKDTVVQWIDDPTSNHGFLLEWVSPRGNHNSPSELRFAQRSEHHDSKQPLLVIYTHELESQLIDDSVDEEASADYEYVDESVTVDGQFSNMDEQQIYKNTTIEHTNDTITQDKIAQIRRDYIRFMNEQHRAEYGPFQTPVKVMAPELHSKLTETHFSVRNPHSQSRRREKRGLPYNKFPKRKKKACSIHELYVDFEEIGWSGWILSPKGYNAYHCKGACQFPLGQNQQPTNHATVQSIVHAFRAGKDIGTPCCVPNQLYSISLLYFDDHENVILKLYDDMVAASCGCH